MFHHKLILLRDYTLSDGSGNQKRPKNGFNELVGFSSFFTTFLTYLMIFQSFISSPFEVLHFEESSNMPKMKKSLVQPAIQTHFSTADTSKKPKTKFSGPGCT